MKNVTLKKFGGSMAAYTAMVAVSVWLVKGHLHSPLRYLFAALPVIPSGFALWAAIRFFRGLDELQRRIQFEPSLQLPGHVPHLSRLGNPAARRPASRRRRVGHAPDVCPLLYRYPHRLRRYQ